MSSLPCKRCRQLIQVQPDYLNAVSSSTHPPRPLPSSSASLKAPLLTPSTPFINTLNTRQSQNGPFLPGNVQPDQSFVMLSDSVMLPQQSSSMNVQASQNSTTSTFTSPGTTRQTNVKSSRPSNSIYPASTPSKVTPETLSIRYHGITKLFEKLTTSSSDTNAVSVVNNTVAIDHPLCQDCAESLVEYLDKQILELKKEKDSYELFLRDWNLTTFTKEEQEKIEKEMSELDKREMKAMESLKDLDQEREALRKEIEELENESKELDQMEAEYWQSFNTFQSRLHTFQQNRDSLNNKYHFHSAHLEKLKKTNVYNDAFRIWHEGVFGTINGWRLGRVPDKPVDWTEINAAWGQACLLLDTLAKKLNFAFKIYKLSPLGSFSRIEKIDGDKTSYELFGSGDLHLGRIFWNRRFDHAMVAFLNCLQQLGDYCELQDENFRLPYRISKDKIGDASIRLQFNQDETWTKACKYTLTNLKWILAFVTKRDLRR